LSPLGIRNEKMPLAGLYLAIFFLAMTGLFAKMIPLNAISIIQLRGVVASFGLAGFMFLNRRKFRISSIKQFIGVYLLGLLLGIHWVTFFYSMQVSTVAVGMLSLFSYPVITILLEPFFSQRRLKLRDMFAGVIIFAGLLIMVSEDIGELQRPVVQGVLWGVFSALLFSLRNIFQKYYFNNLSSECLMFHQVISVGLILAPFVDYPLVHKLATIDWLKIGLLGLISTAAAHTLFVYSLKRMPVKSVSLIGCLQPVIATILAWLIIQEVPNVLVLVGGSIVLSVAGYETLSIACEVKEKTC
jgi:drug/metabolite transporter (DMT)-like permease